MLWVKFSEDRAVAHRRLKAERDAWYKTPQGKRALEREGMLKRANELIHLGKFAEARPLLLTVLTEAPDEPISSHATEGLGEIARRTGDSASALRLYRDFLSVKPGQTWITGRISDPVVRLKYALVLYKAGLYDESWENYESALSSRNGWVLPKPPDVTRRDMPSAQFIFAVNLFLAERLEGRDPAQAIAFVRDAVRANPTSGLPHYYLGELLYSQDETEAKAEFEKAIKYGHGDYIERAKSHLRYWEMTGGPKPKKAAPPVTVVSSEPKPNE